MPPSEKIHYEQQAPKNVREITPAVVSEEMHDKESFLLLDVRENDEWFSGHLPGALHVPLADLKTNIEAIAPDKSTLLILYCRSGVRSASGVQALQQSGYTNVFSMKGGIRLWKAQGYPVTDQ